MILKKIFREPTLVFILSSIFLSIGIPYGIYGLTLDGGASLGGGLILLADIVVIIVLFIDRALVKKIRPIRLSIYEFFILILGLTIYLYSERKLIVEVKNDNIEYLLVIENPGNLNNDKSVLQFPFNQIIATENNFVIVGNIPNVVEFKIDADWDRKYYYNVYEFEKYKRVKLFCKPTHDLRRNMNQELIDSLINTK